MTLKHCFPLHLCSRIVKNFRLRRADVQKAQIFRPKFSGNPYINFKKNSKVSFTKNAPPCFEIPNNKGGVFQKGGRFP